MSQNGGVPSGLEQVVLGLRELERACEVHAAVAKAEYDKAMGELRQVRSMLRAEEPQGKPGPKSPRKGRSQSARYGEEELRILLERIREAPDAYEDIPGSFTTGTLRELGMSKAMAERAAGYLREQEMVRMVGERRYGQGTRLSKVYVIDDGS